jgi:hypothetical protein
LTLCTVSLKLPTRLERSLRLVGRSAPVNASGITPKMARLGDAPRNPRRRNLAFLVPPMLLLLSERRAPTPDLRMVVTAHRCARTLVIR